MSITLHLFAGRDGELATIAARPLNPGASPESVSARTGFVPLSNEVIIASPRRRSTRRVCSEKNIIRICELSNVRSWHLSEIAQQSLHVRCRGMSRPTSGATLGPLMDPSRTSSFFSLDQL